MDAKSRVRELLDRLPNDCSIDDVLYHLYVIQEVEAGRNDVAAGRVTSHDQVVREMRRKWLIGAAG